MVRRKKRRKVQKNKSLNLFKRKLFFVVVIAIVSGIVLYTVGDKSDFGDRFTFAADVHTIKGIDISHHNPIPDWQKLEAEGVNFVYMKATEGTTHEDRNYPSNYAESRQSNIKTGAYHFYIFGQSGREQARHFIRVANSQAGDLIPAIDVEHSPANPYSKNKRYNEKVIKELKELEDEMYEYYGVHPLIYTNVDCYKLYIKGHFPDNLMWIVDLDKEPSSEIKNWRIWQYSHTGKVPGINGHTDLNYYRYTAKEFTELLLPH